MRAVKFTVGQTQSWGQHGGQYGVRNWKEVPPAVSSLVGCLELVSTQPKDPKSTGYSVKCESVREHCPQRVCVKCVRENTVLTAGV